MGTEVAVVTPSLMLGDLEKVAHLIKVVGVDTAEGAVATILRGKTALLPTGRWDLAAQVLAELGGSDEWVANRLQYAQTGVLGD